MNAASDKGRGYGAFILLMLLLLISCNTESTPTRMTAPATSTILPTEVAASPIHGTTTAMPIAPLEAQTLQEIILAQCLEVQSELSMEHRIPWNLFSVRESVPYLLDPSDRTIIALPFFEERTPEGYNKYSGEYHISPDGKWLAYQDTDSSELFIEPTETLLAGSGQNRIIWTQNGRFLLKRWVSNDTVLLNYWKSENTGFITTLFLDPFTGGRYEFSLEQMPNYLNYKLGGAVIATHYFGDGELVPDPTMKRVVYPEMWGDEIYNTLWDIETDTPIARLRYYIDLYNAPLWSLDGKDFLIMGLTEKSVE